MSWLQKAVLFFKSQQQDNQEELSISQIQEWLEQRSQEVIQESDLLPAIMEHAKILEDKRWALEAQLDLWLKKVRVHSSANEIIPLFRETRQLLDLLHFSRQPMIGEVLAVNQELEKRLHEIVKKIEAQDFVQDFNFLFGEDEARVHSDTNPLLAALLDLDAVRKKLDQKVAQSHYNTLHLISSKTEYLRRIVAHFQQLKTEIEAKRGRLAAAGQKKKEKEKSLQQLRSDTKSLDLEELATKKKGLQRKIDETEIEILSFFSKIKPLLQQYKEIEPTNGLLFSYIKDPLSSFFQDEGLFVTDILQKITVLLHEGKFYLNQEDMLSSITALKGLYNSRLLPIKEEYKRLQRELKEVAEQIRHSFFVIKVDDAAYRLDHYHKQAKKLEGEISLLLEKTNKLENIMFRERKELQSLIKSGLGRMVIVALNRQKASPFKARMNAF